MSSKSTSPRKTLADIIREVGTYPEEAYHFIRDGLEYASRSIHGHVTPPQFVVARYMSEEGIDLAEVMERLENGTLDAAVAAAVKQAGGYDQLNRNVSGTDLCWALRDFALRQWGMMADLVLQKWNIKSTDDFGRIVFALVENGFMQKEPHDSIDDFRSVYDFAEVFKPSSGDGDEPDA